MSSGLGLGDHAVLITGASRGLGRSLAERLAAEGCHLALCARKPAPLTEVANALRSQYGVRVYAEAIDVTDHERLSRFVKRSAEAFGGLYGVVANAGGGRGGRLDKSSPADWLATFDVNAVHAATVVRAALPCFDKARGASVVLVSSVSGWKPAPPAQYAAAKAAVIHLAACLGRELGPAGVRVNAVCPGSMLVTGKRWDRMKRDDPEAFARFAGEFPAGRLVDPADVAAVIAFLLSAQSQAVNGSMIPVDGGQNAPSADGY
jgi:3-oxoacyl-[acyl-carrier protein] reductase